VLIASGVGALVLGACSSDAPSANSTKSGATTSSTGASSVTTVTGSVTTLAGTSPVTTTVGGSTNTITPVTSGGTSTQTTTAVTSAATSTTVKGRTVTEPDDNVKIGDKGDGVKKIQFLLKAAGYNVSVDGDFGKQTDTAVKAFQKKYKLKADGIVGKVTWAKLQAVTSPGGATTTTVKK
jgi:hypothetical protein